MEKRNEWLTAAENMEDVKVELVEKEDGYHLETNIYEFLKGFTGRMINTEVLGMPSNRNSRSKMQMEHRSGLTKIISEITAVWQLCPDHLPMQKMLKKCFM